MHVVESLEVGGMENGIVNIVNHIDNIRFDPFICCLSNAGELSNRITNKNVSIITLNWKGGFQPKLFFDLMELFRKEKIDIVHSHGWLTFLYSSIASKMARVPVLINGEHGNFHFEKPIRIFTYKTLAILVDKFLAVSLSLKEELHGLTNIALSRIKVIPNGVDLDKFSPGRPGELKMLKKEVGLPEDSIIIGAVGTLKPSKNQDVLLRVMAVLKDQFKDVYCVLVGDGPCRAKLGAQARTLGIKDRVFFTGYVDDVPIYLKIMDIIVLNSSSEGMSNAILEAMSCETAVVATDIGGNKELVEEGSNGYIIQPTDDAQVEAIKGLLLDHTKMNAFGEKSRKIVESKFSLHGMVNNYEIAYSECMQKKRGV